MSTHNICFHGEIRKMSLLFADLLKAVLSLFFFFGQISRMTQTDSFDFHFFINCH